MVSCSCVVMETCHKTAADAADAAVYVVLRNWTESCKLIW